MLRLRARALASIRSFFFERNALEVETPWLESVPASDPYIEPFPVGGRYLRSSPEFLMKRLLAVCDEDIYQVGKVFRRRETGLLHNPEFTMLEWYRQGWDYRRLMSETDDLLRRLFSLRRSLPDSGFRSYRDVFVDALGIDPWTDDAGLFIARARKLGFTASCEYGAALDFLMDTVARADFPRDRLTFIYDYPPQQAALARVRGQVAERFEVYSGHVELVNGYTELVDADECRRRFVDDNETCVRIGKSPRAISEALIDVLRRGLPDCAGASLGIDRVLMLISGTDSVASTLSFDWHNA